MPTEKTIETSTSIVSGWASEGLVFDQAAPQGFGDRHNSWGWCMLWWKGRLYVGTNRAWHCAERAGINSAFPLIVKYPSKDPDALCTEDPSDLPLQAEIWRWTPEADEWERVFQSPQDAPIPKKNGEYVAREVGFRDMAVFVESDGTEAMYVSGVNARFIYRPMVPPRLLRSTDGLHFEPVPQDPGTFLGQLDTCSFRTIAVYKGRLFVITGNIQGDGVLLESSDPAGGNDHFRQVSPPGMTVFEAIPFNDHLYVGVRDVKGGYAVLRTDAMGSPPYTFTPVVPNGGFLAQPSRGVISMHIFKGRLYVGTDRPATEVIRINPDDTWDLVIGAPRETPSGWKYPLSGLDAGFNNWLNGHIWRMQSHDGRLYIGTMNMSTHLREMPGVDAVLEPCFGFDFFETDDGWHYAPITTNGFGDKFNCGLRSFASTPYGLFLGIANNWYGLQIWRGKAENASGQPPPGRLEVEYQDERTILSWERPREATQFRIWRAEVSDQRRKIEGNPFLSKLLQIARAVFSRRPDIYLPPLPDRVWIPGNYEEIGVTEQAYFEDAIPLKDKRYLYYVRAEFVGGEFSVPSNIVSVPLLTPPATFEDLIRTFDTLDNGSEPGSKEIEKRLAEMLEKASTSLKEGDIASTEDVLQRLSHQLMDQLEHSPGSLALEDFYNLLLKLQRRVALIRTGLIQAERLYE